MATVFWGWGLLSAAAFLIVMAYSGMLDGVGNALFELAKDTARYLID